MIKGESMKSNCAIYISQIKQINTRLLNKMLIDRGVVSYNAEQSRILHFLWGENKIVSTKDISELSELTMSSLTTMLARMEKQNLIKRENDSKDRRKILVSLTEFGKSLQKEYEEIIQLAIKNVFEDFSENEYKEFENYLKRVHTNLKKLEAKNKE